MDGALLKSVLQRIVPLAADRRITDADLISRWVSDRDESAFAALVQRHGPLVWAVCRQLLPMESDAEDAFQATFVVLVRGAKSIRKPAALGVWLHGVAYRIAQKAKRTAGRRRKHERAAAAAEAGSPVSQTAWNQLQDAVHTEIARLPEALRTAFVLCELEGAGQHDAAAALGWKLGTLSGRLSKARQQLLSRLARHGVSAGAIVAGATAGGAASASAPFHVVSKAIALAQSGIELNGAIPLAVLQLAHGATEAIMTRTRLLVTAVAVAAALAAGTVTILAPRAAAQKNSDPNSSAQPAANTRAAYAQYAGPSRTVTAGQWEYKFVPRKADSLEAFELLLKEHGAAGWEYCGVESLLVTDASRKAEWGTNPTVVFKRPKTSAQGSTTGTGSTMRRSGDASPFGSGKGSRSIPMEPTRRDPNTDPALPKIPTDESRVDPFRKAPDELKLVQLKYATANTLANTLDALFGGRSCKIVSEPRTNSILLSGDTTTVDAVIAVIQKLDVPAKSDNAPSK